jgi:hypothetical protein
MIGPMQKSKLILISPIFSINTVRTVNDVRYIGGPQDQEATPGSAVACCEVGQVTPQSY